MFRKRATRLYTNLILANLQAPSKKDGITIIRPKLLVGLTHMIGGAKSWERLEEIATFPDTDSTKEGYEKRKKCISDFKEIMKNYSMNKVSKLFLNLFLKAGWRDRRGAGLVVENMQRRIDREAIENVINAKRIYLDTIYIYFNEGFHEVTSYAPFSYEDKRFTTGAAYFIRADNWRNTEDSQSDLVEMLKKENNIIKKKNT